jgi:hypothetical protein
MNRIHCKNYAFILGANHIKKVDWSWKKDNFQDRQMLHFRAMNSSCSMGRTDRQTDRLSYHRPKPFVSVWSNNIIKRKVTAGNKLQNLKIQQNQLLPLLQNFVVWVQRAFPLSQFTSIQFHTTLAAAAISLRMRFQTKYTKSKQKNRVYGLSWISHTQFPVNTTWKFFYDVHNYFLNIYWIEVVDKD